MTLSDLIHRYTTDPRELSTPRSQETYRDCLTAFVTFLISSGHENSVRSFTPDNVEAWVGTLFGHGLKASSVNLRLSALAGLAAWCMRQRAARGRSYIMDSNPVQTTQAAESPAPGASMAHH